MDTWDATVHHLLPPTPHWYLGVLATDPAHAGRRWGRAVMEHGLARAAAEGLPAYLETATESNVDLYRRSGWEVTGTEVVGPVTAHVMRHPRRRRARAWRQPYGLDLGDGQRAVVDAEVVDPPVEVRLDEAGRGLVLGPDRRRARCWRRCGRSRRASGPAPR